MKRAALFLLMMVMAFSCARADMLRLPESLTALPSQSFSGIRTDFVYFPESVRSIADDAFEGASFIGIGRPGGIAEQWCRANGFSYNQGLYRLPVMTLARLAEGFVFSGENGAESNPEERMAHNIYTDPDLSGTSGRFSLFTIDFMAEEVPLNTYWALCNWAMDVSSLSQSYEVTDGGGAYAGLQFGGNGPVGIMSFWEIHYNKDGKDTILNAKRVYPAGEESHFDGEGEGTNYIGAYNWQPGRWYRMTIQCVTGDNGNTMVEQWFMDLDTGTWTMLSRFDTGLQNSCFIGNMSQFMENYWYETSNEFRSFRYKNIWVMEDGTSQWIPITGAWVSTDTWWDNKKGYFAFGSDGQSLWGVTCGYGPDVVKTNPDVLTSAYYTIPQGGGE